MRKINRKVKIEDITEGSYIDGKISKEKSDKVKALLKVYKGTKEEMDYRFYYLASLGMRIGELTILYNRDIEKYNNKKQNKDNKKKNIKLESAKRKRRRFFEGNFKNTDTKVIELDGKENKNAVISYILNTYPTPQFFDAVYKVKNWSGAKMKEIFNSSADTSTSQVVIGKRKYELRGLEYSEEEYTMGIQAYIRKQKKKIPLANDIWIYVIMSIRPSLEESEQIEGVRFQKYEIKIMNCRYYIEIQKMKKEYLAQCGKEKCNYFSCNNDFCVYKEKRRQYEREYVIEAPLDQIVGQSNSRDMKKAESKKI
ncbi:hypothetical protein [Anaerosporobacter sp.]